jgi:hypothetical protein
MFQNKLIPNVILGSTQTGNKRNYSLNIASSVVIWKIKRNNLNLIDTDFGI